MPFSGRNEGKTLISLSVLPRRTRRAAHRRRDVVAIGQQLMIPSALEPLFEKETPHEQDLAILSMWSDSPQGMHVNLRINGTILINRHGLIHEVCEKSCDSCEFCDLNLIFVLSIPPGVYIDPFELHSRHDFLYQDILIHFHRNYRMTYTPESFAEDSIPFVIGVEVLHLPINRHTLSAQLSLNLPLHLRYHSSSFEGESIVSVIPTPALFLGEYENWGEHWDPGIWIDYGGTPVGSSPSWKHSLHVERIRSQHQEGSYQEALVLSPLCGCLKPFLESSVAHSFSDVSLLPFSLSCPESSSQLSYPHFNQNPSCFSSLELHMPFPYGISSKFVILVTALIISSTTIFLSWILIRQKKIEKENEEYRER